MLAKKVTTSTFISSTAATGTTVTTTSTVMAATASPASSPPDVACLSARAQEILKDIISTYIAAGEPVSSRAVSKHAQHSLSAASIRNVMADLEDLGLLVQPHTSAGRIPTQAAYRLFVESLMPRRELSPEEKRYIEEHLQSAGPDAENLMNVASHLLSELSRQVSLVVAPMAEETVLKSIDFVSLGSRRVLCVVVSKSGFIDHVAIESDEELPREELVRISNYLTENFAGMKLRAIRDRLLGLMADERADVDRWLAQAIELGRRAVREQEPEVLVEGTTVLLDRPEMASVERIRRMLDTFADKARLVAMLNRCLASEGVRVFIGEDSDVTSELDFSLVATSYGIDRWRLGSLGIIGPSRMEYQRIIPLVHYLGETLSRALASVNKH